MVTWPGESSSLQFEKVDMEGGPEPTPDPISSWPPPSTPSRLPLFILPHHLEKKHTGLPVVARPRVSDALISRAKGRKERTKGQPSRPKKALRGLGTPEGQAVGHESVTFKKVWREVNHITKNLKWKNTFSGTDIKVPPSDSWA